jgi:hypothetical protein
VTFNEGTETMVKISGGSHDLVQMEDGFITFEIIATFELDDQFKADVPTTGHNPVHQYWSDDQETMQIFVGFKNSAEILYQLQIISQNKSVGLQNNNCAREAFAYHTIRPMEAKKKRFDHSLWDHVVDHWPQVCGTYIPLKNFVDNGSKHPVTVTFEINLPVTDILPLQAFTLWPRFCLDDLELKFYVKRDALVWAQCNPSAIYEEKVAMGDLTYNTTHAELYKTINSQIKHSFTQINNRSKIVCWTRTTAATAAQPDVIQDACLHCTSFVVNKCKSTILGFDIVPSAKQEIVNFFATPQYIPAQELVFYSFPHGPTPNGLDSSINVPLFNCNCISFMFPRHANDLTVFENIMYTDCQVNINGRNYPDEPISTLGARFLQYQMIAPDLDGPIEPTPEYLNSLTRRRNNPHNGARYNTPPSDDTSFMFNVQLERSGAGYCIDGMNTNGQNVSISFKGTPMVKGLSDSYMYPETFTINADPSVIGNYDKSNITPQIWICQEPFWRICCAQGEPRMMYIDAANCNKYGPTNIQVPIQ